MTTTAKRTVEDIVTDRIIAQLEAGTAPWRKPWVTVPGLGAPANVTSKKPYRGLNAMVTAMSPFTEPWWITKNQCGDTFDIKPDVWAEPFHGCTPVVLWKDTERSCKPDDAGARLKNGRWVRKSFLMRFYQVWNVQQLVEYDDDNTLHGLIPEPPAPPAGGISDLYVAADDLFASYTEKHRIPVVVADHAFYSPPRDFIGMPPMQAFDGLDSYYGVAFHEGVHSSGHADRLARPGVVESINTKGSPKYALEELVAEIGSAMLMARAGLEPRIEQSAAYVQSWLRALEDDRRLVITAAQQAQKAVDLIINKPMEDQS